MVYTKNNNGGRRSATEIPALPRERHFIALFPVRMPGTILLALVLLLVPSLALGAALQADTTWSGEVSVEEDILVPEGVTLTILPGTTVRVKPAESTKTDPEYMSPLTEITVRGTLVSDGKEGSPVSFLRAGENSSPWAGLIIDGGSAVMRSSVISGAETGIAVVKGSLSLSKSLLTKNRYGLTVYGHDAAVRVATSQVRENDYGVFLFDGARMEQKDTVVRGNSKKDSYATSAREDRTPFKEYTAGSKEAGRIFGDEVILGTVVWQDRVEVRGIVRVPENSRLVVLPGTVVEFTKKDTNHDGIGENGLLIQGAIIAKGTKERPIIFRSAEKRRRMGDWDSINIMNSDTSQNIIEYCQIEDAYRGLHFHYSVVAVADSVVRNNYRGIQFQESIVDIRRTHLYGNKSGLQARDSEIVFADNMVHSNGTGMNVFRNSIVLTGNRIVHNRQEGLRVREGLPVVERNLIDGNRYGLAVSDALYGTFSSNVISHNLEAGISLRGDDNIEVRGNAVQGNGLFGLTVQDTGALIRGNLISDNGERGVGIQSFQGVLTDNNILRNGLYNLGVEGPGDVPAAMNWWGTGDVRPTIYDRANDASRGKAEYLPLRKEPVLFAWPLPAVPTDATWRGDMSVNGRIEVEPGSTLHVMPATRVLFAPGAGLTVKGKIISRGEPKEPVLYTAASGTGAGLWDEVLLDHAAGSAFSSTIFRNATWALHSHFTDLTVDACSFTDNYGGLRFTSGPLDVRRSYFGRNEVGIRDFRGTALITENIISGNRIGIFVREQGGGLTLRKNNLAANQEYSVRIGDFNDQDVDARNNWWGSGNPLDAIYDARQEPGIGSVLYEPYARKPYALVPPTPEVR